MRIALLLATIALSVVTGKANLITNGDFESFTTSGSPNDSNHGYYTEFYGPPDTSSNAEITGWTLVGNSGTSPNQVDLVGSTGGWPAYSGTYSLAMSGQHGSAGVIQQSFTTTPGDVYTLSFAYANNPAGAGDSLDIFVTGAGALLSQSVSHNTSAYLNMDYTLFSESFTADSSSATLKFSEITNTGFGVVLDDVSVEPGDVPEPLPAGMLSVGLAGLAILRRRAGHPRSS